MSDAQPMFTEASLRTASALLERRKDFKAILANLDSHPGLQVRFTVDFFEGYGELYGHAGPIPDRLKTFLLDAYRDWLEAGIREAEEDLREQVGIHVVFED